MFEHRKIRELDDFFVELNNRQEQAVYFYRVDAYSAKVESFFIQYYKAARASGMVFEGKMLNPTGQQLAYYQEILGDDFEKTNAFILASLAKWLPGLPAMQSEHLAQAMMQVFATLEQQGKNANIIKNAYIKFMCWLYYKCRWMLQQLGTMKVPKILYEGTVSSYELAFLSVLSKAGCDVVLLLKDGEDAYLQIDKEGTMSDRFVFDDMQAMPEYFGVKWLQEKVKNEVNLEKLYGSKPTVKNATNIWLEGNIFKDIRKEFSVRGEDTSYYYNCFCRMRGVEDKLTYLNELYQMQFSLKNKNTPIVIVNEQIPAPSLEEIAAINRKQYQTVEQLLMDLLANLQPVQDMQLQALVRKAFLDTMIAESRKADQNINKLTGIAVYLLCWLKRYQRALFSGWQMPKVSCFIYLGTCKNRKEALFLKMLAKLPVDVLVLQPDLQSSCCLEDANLYEEHYEDSLCVTQFPTEDSQVSIPTAAYHAERELETSLYQESGIYKNQQYAKANSIRLQTMYEEIAILWQEEVKYRPNFSTVNDVVNVPVIFAKVSGVKDQLLKEYWQSVKELVTEDTFVINKAPYWNRNKENPMQAQVSHFLKNGKVCVEEIKRQENYPYAVLREEMQNHIFAKMQLLIDQKWIRGTFENGTEYTIVATIMNLEKAIVRLIQKFDFTKKNPKLIYINTGDEVISLEDSILVAFLHLIGFDIVFFVPTGYQNIEKHFNRKIFDEHQIGEYMYDLRVPDIAKKSSGKRGNLLDKFFKKGR